MHSSMIRHELIVENTYEKINEKMYLANTMEQQSTERILNLQDQNISISIFSLCNKGPYALLKREGNLYSMTIKDFVRLQFDLEKDEYGKRNAKDAEEKSVMTKSV